MKKKLLFSSFVLILAFCTSVHAKDNTKILKHISDFEKAPLDEKTRPTYSAIMKFATESDDVQVTISMVNCPWLKYDKLNMKWKGVLIVAFTAGNIKPQLVSGIKENNSYSGVLLALRTYEKIRKADKSFIVKELNRYLELEKKGKLKSELIKLEKEKK